MQIQIRILLALFISVFISTAIMPLSVHAQNLNANANVPDALSEHVKQLTKVKLKDTAALLDEMAATGEPTLVGLFKAMLAGQLYYEKSSQHLAELTKNTNGNYVAQSLFNPNLSKDNVSKSSYKKIRVNNKLRSKLRELIALVQINSNDIELRQQAVVTMIGNVTPTIKDQLNQRLDIETDQGVKDALTLAIAVYDLNESPELETQLSAINILKNSLHPQARNALNQVVETNENKPSNEVSTKLISAAQSALKKIDKKVRFYGFLEQLFFGLSLGSVLLLAAIGLSITFGVMGVINMAHGEMMMLGAYTTYVIQLLLPNHIGLSVLLAIPAAFCVSGFIGILIERGVIQFLKGRPLETLLATFGISLILQQLVRSIFSPLNRQVITPEWLSGSLVINDVFSITYNRLYILIFALLIFAALQMLLKLSKLGLNVRAVSQNRSMARAMGIRTERVDAMTFGLGSGVAGIAGVALSQLTNVGPNLGQSYIIDSFMVVVFGGVGNLLGTVIGAFSLGITNKFLEPMTGAVMANIIILVFIILFIQRRPQGLFPQKGRAAND